MFNLVIGLLCLYQALSAPVGTAGKVVLLLIGILNDTVWSQYRKKEKTTTIKDGFRVGAGFATAELLVKSASGLLGFLAYVLVEAIL